jgi:uncharacterized membrane protein
VAPGLRLLPTLVLLGGVAVPVEFLASRDLAPLLGEPGPAARGSLERCYGVARAGADDCQAFARRCAGRSLRDGQGDAWIWLPAGLCARLVGGSLSPIPEGERRGSAPSDPARERSPHR